MSVTLRTKKLQNGAFSYYLDIYLNGIRTKETLFKVCTFDDKIEKKLLAEKIRNQRAVEVDYQGTDFTPSYKKNIQVLAYCKKYTDDYTKADKRVIECSIKKFADFLSFKRIRPTITFKELHEKTVRDFADFLNYDAGLSGTTPIGYFKKFKMILTEARAEKLLDSSFLSGYRFRRRSTDTEKEVPKNILTEEEINMLWDTECLNEEIKKAFLYSCYTGLGLAEIAILKWKSIKENMLDTNRKKNNRRIHNMISPRMMAALGERKNDNELVFNLISKKTKKIYTTNGVNALLKKFIENAGIKKHITFYCGRHTFAVRLLINNTNLKTVADAMGHSNTTTTNKYLNNIDFIKHIATGSLA
ncbi:tyrosine-type recombinase/integrase [Chryseobacterium luquanense]|uniref:Site-specific integrase n=1 Tax=Chryseobacterium luquanense TaxID=2983766 RepID=A0ABT3Y1Z6_9FLAO|nr:site-specific integrase [Chryseobacterium luquanense]MCX8532155.1 site-specific integrase [Chryseobacterium luquanense]